MAFPEYSRPLARHCKGHCQNNRGPDLLDPPYDSSGKNHGRKEVCDISVEACCDAPPAFEAAEHALDDVALRVGCLAIVLPDPAA